MTEGLENEESGFDEVDGAVVSVIIWKGTKGNILYGRVAKEETGIGRTACK